jgi:phospholipase/lecithinase/hemolysin
MPKLGTTLGIAGFFLTSLLTPLPAIAALFSETYIFGDSISDIGRLYALSGNQVPVSPPYAQKLSNGPLWIEYLQGYLGIPVNPATNFALAGATTGSINTTLPQPLGIGIEQQVTDFVTNFPLADAQALYVLWGGANDYLGGGVIDPTIPVTNLENHITSLYSVGARNFFVPNLANLGQLPQTNPNTDLTQRSIAHAALLQTSLQNLSNTLPNSKIIYFDAFSVISDITNNPSRYQITNVSEACLPTAPLDFPRDPLVVTRKNMSIGIAFTLLPAPTKLSLKPQPEDSVSLNPAAALRYWV